MTRQGDPAPCSPAAITCTLQTHVHASRTCTLHTRTLHRLTCTLHTHTCFTHTHASHPHASHMHTSYTHFTHSHASYIQACFTRTHASHGSHAHFTYMHTHTHTLDRLTRFTDSHASRMHGSCTVHTCDAHIHDVATGALLLTPAPLSRPHCPGVWRPHESGLFCSSEESPGCFVTPPTSWALPAGGGGCRVSGQRLCVCASPAGSGRRAGMGAGRPGPASVGVRPDGGLVSFPTQSLRLSECP